MTDTLVVADDVVVDTPVGPVTGRALDLWSSHDAAEAMRRSFEGYLVPMSIDGPGFARRFRAEDIDPFLSRVYLAGHADDAADLADLVGIALVFRRGRTARIGGFGCVSAHRGRGVARAVMDDVLRRTIADGADRVLLEVITANTAAVRLYERLGFQQLRRLVGYVWNGPEDAAPTTRPIEVDPIRVARALGRYGPADPPWQLAPETLAAAVPPRRAFSLDDRAFALVNAGAETASLTAIVVHPDHRRRGYGTRLLAGLRAAFPGRSWTVPQVVPDDAAPEFFAATGWVRHELEQVEMGRSLTA